jgi:outer membrane protein assembly factor BamB
MQVAGTALGGETASLGQAVERLAPEKAGLAVIVAPADAVEAAEALRRRASFVQVLSTHSEKIAAHRAAILDGGPGGVSIRGHRGGSLPYVDNLVNLLVLPRPAAVADAERERVLAPGGTCLEAGPGGWSKWTKPWPEGMDQWTHYLHDSTNNAVGRDRVVDVPRGIQWVGGPRWTRHHDHISSVSAIVSAQGRLFYISDGSSSVSIHFPPQWSLIAKDAFSGVCLWTRPIEKWVNPLWPLKSGPATVPRRLIAAGGAVYVTLGIDAPVSCLDAKTGSRRFVFPGTEHTQEMVLCDGILICLVWRTSAGFDAYGPQKERSPEEERAVDGKWAWEPAERCIRAFDADGGDALWQVSAPATPLSLAANRESVLFHDGERIHAVDRRTGGRRWISEPVSRRSSIAPYYGVNLVAAAGVVLFAGGDRTMTALDAGSGKVLWEAEHPASGYRSPEDLFVIGDEVLAGDLRNIKHSGTVTVRDLKTGDTKRVFAEDPNMPHFPHHRCYRSKATERFVLTSRTGIEFLDTATGSWLNHHWVRGACLVGIMPSGGLVYAPSHHCLCYAEAKLEGFHALSPRPAASSADATPRLVTGPACERLKSHEPSGGETDSWPMHRHDARRSGSTPVATGALETKVWETPVGARLTSPVVAEGSVVVADCARHAVHALDAKTGKKRWRFLAGGRVDSAPTLFRGRAIFGCTDGWIYCLELEDGREAWRFRAAPSARQHVAYGQVESVWPVHGSILIKDDEIHAVAGRSRFTDGGMRLLRINPITGAKISEKVFDERRSGDGKPVQDNFRDVFAAWQAKKRPDLMTFDDVGVSDVLATQRDLVFMRGYRLPFRGEGSPTPQTAKLRVPWGLLTGQWSHRTGWRYGGSPRSRILVFDDQQRVFGFGFTVRYQTLLKPFAHHLYGRKLAPGKAETLWPDQELPFLVRAMNLAKDTLIVAGPPDYNQFDQPAAYGRHGEEEFRRQMRRQAAAWAGEKGGILWTIDAKTGARSAEFALESPPVFDGMASTSSGVYLSTMDGRVLLLGRP